MTDFGSAPTLPTTPASFPGRAELPTDVVVWGPDIADESTLKLIGNPSGKRILQLGVARGHSAVALALAGARVIVVDPDIRAIEEARALADLHEVKIELHHGDLAEIPFIRADAIDNALSVFALHRIDDVDRLLRQVNRVLRTGGSFTCSLPHPVWAMIDHNAFGPPRILRSYGDGSEQIIDGVTMYPRGVADIVAAFGRANFRVDTILEPIARPDAPSEFWSETMALVPATLIVRGRKDGV